MNLQNENLLITKELLEITLKQVKELIDKGNIEFQCSAKNLSTFRQLRREQGITHDDFQSEVLEAIKNLTISNYYQGPDSDHNTSRDLVFWKFGTKIFNKEIYLKFTIEEKNGEKVVVWSYHFPDYTINYPFR